MHIEQGSTTKDAQGQTRINFCIVIEASYAPGDAVTSELNLQKEFNKAGTLAMGHFLKTYDTVGEAILLGGRRFTSKGVSPQVYQSAFGAVEVSRHVYQNSSGGQTYCPMEDRARTIQDATPHFAKILSAGYCDMSGRSVIKHLENNLGREVCLEYVQNVAHAVGQSALAQESAQPYKLQTDPTHVAAVVVLADATCAHIVDEGWKHVAAGAFVLLDAEGEILETIYLANAPEEGKVTFWKRMDLEYERLMAWLAAWAVLDVKWYGLCDGAEEIQNWLEQRCDILGLDFYHVTEYVGAVKAAFGDTPGKQQNWLATALSDLKHKAGAAEALLKQVAAKAKKGHPIAAVEAALNSAEGYLGRNLDRMEYSLLSEANLPIGSGIIEAACKHVVKRRSGVSGARWKRPGLQSTLALRSLWLSSNRFDQYWGRVARFGY